MLAGAANPPTLPANPTLEAAGVPLYPDLETYFAGNRADLAVISGPIQVHAPQTCLALAHGAHVLCEKPAAAAIQEVLEMRAAEQRVGRFAAIGYQWSFSPAVQALKRDIQAGRFGRPLRLKTLVLWPRHRSYYTRNDWAGRLRSAGGHWVLDSPVQNATAHYLHNMFYLLGPTREQSSLPVSIEAELYRANPIETYDAAALRCLTASGVEVLYYAAHCVPEFQNPLMHFQFERGEVRFDGGGDRRFTAHLPGGEVVDYGTPDGAEDEKLAQTLNAVRGGPPPACGLEAASAHILAANGAQQSCPVWPFPPEQVRITCTEDNQLTWAEGLQEALWAAFEGGLLPVETGRFAWARRGPLLDLRGYTLFEGVPKFRCPP